MIASTICCAATGRGGVIGKLSARLTPFADVETMAFQAWLMPGRKKRTAEAILE
jgi:hypothetical protein